MNSCLADNATCAASAFEVDWPTFAWCLLAAYITLLLGALVFYELRSRWREVEFTVPTPTPVGGVVVETCDGRYQLTSSAGSRTELVLHEVNVTSGVPTFVYRPAPALAGLEMSQPGSVVRKVIGSVSPNFTVPLFRGEEHAGHGFFITGPTSSALVTAGHVASALGSRIRILHKDAGAGVCKASEFDVVWNFLTPDQDDLHPGDIAYAKIPYPVICNTGYRPLAHSQLIYNPTGSCFVHAFHGGEWCYSSGQYAALDTPVPGLYGHRATTFGGYSGALIYDNTRRVSGMHIGAANEQGGVNVYITSVQLAQCFRYLGYNLSPPRAVPESAMRHARDYDEDQVFDPKRGDDYYQQRRELRDDYSRRGYINEDDDDVENEELSHMQADYFSGADKGGSSHRHVTPLRDMDFFQRRAKPRYIGGSDVRTYGRTRGLHEGQLSEVTPAERVAAFSQYAQEQDKNRTEPTPAPETEVACAATESVAAEPVVPVTVEVPKPPVSAVPVPEAAIVKSVTPTGLTKNQIRNQRRKQAHSPQPPKDLPLGPAVSGMPSTTLRRSLPGKQHCAGEKYLQTFTSRRELHEHAYGSKPAPIVAAIASGKRWWNNTVDEKPETLPPSLTKKGRTDTTAIASTKQAYADYLATGDLKRLLTDMMSVPVANWEASSQCQDLLHLSKFDLLEPDPCNHHNVHEETEGVFTYIGTVPHQSRVGFEHGDKLRQEHVDAMLLAYGETLGLDHHALPPGGRKAKAAMIDSLISQAKAVNKKGLGAAGGWLDEKFRQTLDRMPCNAKMDDKGEFHSPDLVELFNEILSGMDGDKSAGWSAYTMPGPKSAWMKGTMPSTLLRYTVLRLCARIVYRHVLPTMSPGEMWSKGLVDPRQVFLKAEAHSVKKQTAKRWRLIWVSSFVDLMCQSLLHHTMNKAQIKTYQADYYFTSIMSGSGHHEEGLTSIGHKFKYVARKSPTGEVSSSDASGWDFSVSRDEMLVEAEYRHICEPVEREWSDTRYELLIAEALCNSAHVLNVAGMIVACNVFGILASGIASTTAMNSFIRVLTAFLSGVEEAAAGGDDLFYAGRFSEAVFDSIGHTTKAGSCTTLDCREQSGLLEYNSHHFTFEDGTLKADRTKDSCIKTLSNLELKHFAKPPSSDTICGIAGALSGTPFGGDAFQHYLSLRGWDFPVQLGDFEEYWDA